MGVKNRTELQKWKTVTFYFSVIFLFIGGMVTAMGVWGSFGGVLFGELDELLAVMPISFIIIGSFVFVISFMGWFSSRRESKALLLVYILMLIISFGVILGLSIGTYVVDLNAVDANLYQAWKTEFESEGGTESETLYDLELSHRCCGFNNATDMEVPVGMCLVLIKDAADGCKPILVEDLIWSLRLVFIVGLVAAFVQAVGLIFGILTYRDAPSQYELDELLSEEAKKLNESWQTSIQKK